MVLVFKLCIQGTAIRGQNTRIGPAFQVLREMDCGESVGKMCVLAAVMVWWSVDRHLWPVGGGARIICRVKPPGQDG